jgi:hypothetical protein
VSAPEAEVEFHLLLEPQESPLVVRALELLISDEAHEPAIRTIAREVIERVNAHPEISAPGPSASVALNAQQMKITHTALGIRLLDSTREQSEERELLRAVLEKLPDEHVMRAISLD